MLMLAVLLTVGVILVNGWTDAPNAIASCVVTRCMPIRAAILMAALFNFLGVFVMTRLNATVAVKITKIVNFGTDEQSPHRATLALCAAMLSIVVWATLAWRLGIPTSESHSLIAGLTGSALAMRSSLDGVNTDEWTSVLLGLLLSVVFGFGLGFLICKTVARLCQRMERGRTQPVLRRAQIAGGAGMAFMHGAQDGQKFMGVILLCTYLSAGQTPDTVTAPHWLMLTCSLLMAIGTAIGGKRIIKAVGMDMVHLEKHQGFAADLAAGLSLLVCSLTGLPVSTTHVKTMAVMGAGAAKRWRSVKLTVVKDMALTWVLTFPGCGLLAFFTTKLLMRLL